MGPAPYSTAHGDADRRGINQPVRGMARNTQSCTQSAHGTPLRKALLALAFGLGQRTRVARAQSNPLLPFRGRGGGGTGAPSPAPAPAPTSVVPVPASPECGDIGRAGPCEPGCGDVESCAAWGLHMAHELRALCRYMHAVSVDAKAAGTGGSAIAAHHGKENSIGQQCRRSHTYHDYSHAVRCTFHADVTFLCSTV
jgi:hypothetical protein